MIAAGADTLSREKPFVCQTTPHFGSTLRKASYSVHAHHTTKISKCKYLICDKFQTTGKYPVPLVKMSQISTKKALCPLAFCALLLYNGGILKGEGQLWAK